MLEALTYPNNEILNNREVKNVRCNLREVSLITEKDREIARKEYLEKDLEGGAEEEYIVGEMEKLQCNREKYASQIVKVMNICLERDIDTIMFLDKAARPWWYPINETWNNLEKKAQEEGKTFPEKPNIIFRNIGTETNLDPTDLDTLRMLDSFTEGLEGFAYEQVGEKRDGNPIWSEMNVLIIDNAEETYRTKNTTYTLMHEAGAKDENITWFIIGDAPGNSMNPNEKAHTGVIEYDPNRVEREGKFRDRENLTDDEIEELHQKYQYGLITQRRELEDWGKAEVRGVREGAFKHLSKVIAENATFN